MLHASYQISTSKVLYVSTFKCTAMWDWEWEFLPYEKFSLHSFKKKIFFKDIAANHNYAKTLTPFYVSFEKIIGYLGDMGNLCELIKRYISSI